MITFILLTFKHINIIFNRVNDIGRVGEANVRYLGIGLVILFGKWRENGSDEMRAFYIVDSNVTVFWDCIVYKSLLDTFYTFIYSIKHLLWYKYLQDLSSFMEEFESD